MKQTEVWKPAIKAKPELPPVPNRSHERAKTAICLVILVGSAVWVLAAVSSVRWVLELLLFIPQVVCGEWLGRRYLGPDSRLSVANSGFSVLRILFGVLAGMGLLAAFIFWLAR
jgi:hypothetical protein